MGADFTIQPLLNKNKAVSSPVKTPVDIVVAAAWSPMGDNQGSLGKSRLPVMRYQVRYRERDMPFLRFRHGGSPRCGEHHRASLSEGQL